MDRLQLHQLQQNGIYRIWPPIGGVPQGMNGTPGGEQMAWGSGPWRFNGLSYDRTEGYFTHYDGSPLTLKSFDRVSYFPARARSRKSRKNRKTRKSRKNNRR